jgi:hypothetical protein
MIRIIILIMIVTIGGGLRCLGQTYHGQPVTITVPEVLVLQPANSPALNFNFNSTTALDNGLVITGTTIRYYSNKAWFVTIQSGSANFSGGQGNMPASVLKFKNSQNSTFTDLSPTAQSLSGTTGAKNMRGTGTIGVDFKMDPGYLNPPANNYSITVTYTISNL